jgi:signal transduction histidine kinase
VFDIFLENYVLAVAQFAFLVVLVTNIYMIKENRWYAGQTMVTFISYAVLILYLSVTGADKQNNYIWSFSLPLFSIVLFGTRKGVIYSAVYFLFFIAILVAPFSWNNAYSLNVPVKVNSVQIYLGITLISYMYEFSKAKITSDLENKFQNSLNEKKLKDDFISKLSHQIRTPLNNLMVISNLLSETKMDDKQKDMLETIQASTNNLVNVVNNISKVSAIDYGLMNVNLNFNLYSTINSTIRLFSSMHSDRYDIKLIPNQL